MISYENIEKSIKDAARKREEVAMFHFQVLINAESLDNVDPVEFCRQVSMNDSYATEFRKMLALAKLMNDMGIIISKKIK